MAESQLMTARTDARVPLAPCAWDRDITFFVACYNEEENIVATLDALTGALAEVNCTWEILVIDDCSKDRSVELIQRYIQEHPDLPIYCVVNEENRGLAQNYIEGAFLGRGKYYRLVCGDNVEPKETFITLLRHLGKADMIIPYQDECPGKSWFRRWLSKTYTCLVNTLGGYRIRYYNGMPICQRYHVMRWNTNSGGFSFQADMITRLLDKGFSYIEVPRVTIERTKGHSTALTWSNLFAVMHTLVGLFVRRVARVMRRKKKARLGGRGRKGIPAAPVSGSNGYHPAQAQKADSSTAHSLAK